MSRTILSWALWPLSVAGVLVSLLYFANLHDAGSLYGVMSVTAIVLLALLLAFELVLPFRADWRLRGDRDLLRDIGHYVLYGPIGSTAAQLVFLTGLAGLLAPLHLPSLWPRQSPFLLQVLAVIVLGDLLEYWLHRLSHSIPALWRVHAVHHMPVRLHMLKAGRHHVLYFLLRGLIVWTPLVLVGVPAALIAWQIVAASVTGNVAHANIDFRIPKVMHRILVTPQFHRLHHSTDRVHGNSNFGVLLPVWDMLFGTHANPVTTPLSAVGIEGDPIPHRWLIELGWPLLPGWVASKLAGDRGSTRATS
jgi:sterol desaturase/sphingolipid hydroxylase (fatty acid hydroxylase superfamily)